MKLLVSVFLLAAVASGVSAADSRELITSPKLVFMLVPDRTPLNLSQVERVQSDPYCPGGTSSCGQFCDTVAGRHECSPNAVCCYPGNGQPADCVHADKCQ